MNIDFAHRQSAHCESGTASNLLFYSGLDVSESLSFGIGCGLFFAYVPFVKINKLPLITYRSAIGGILTRVMKELGVEFTRKKFPDPQKGMDALDEKLEQGIPVGCQTGAYWLPYFPPAFRFHFNGHNLVVYGRENNEYLVSDPVMPESVTISRNDLIKARYAKGILAPKGRMYYLSNISENYDFKIPIINGIKTVCKSMIKSPFPLIGVKGMRYLAKKLESWPKKFGPEEASVYMGHIIRMQEEIGTGGAGFRFIYAAFLQEAHNILNDERLLSISDKFTAVGDQWRDFAVIGARHCKGRAKKEDTYLKMADILRNCSYQEEEIYEELLDTANGF